MIALDYTNCMLLIVGVIAGCMLPLLVATLFRPGKRLRPICFLVGDLLILGGIGLALLLSTPPRLRELDIPVLEAKGDAIVRAIHRYREVNGIYPSALSELPATGEFVVTRFGEFAYRTAEGGEVFSLRVGSYRENLFVLSWDEGSQRWRWDR